MLPCGGSVEEFATVTTTHRETIGFSNSCPRSRSAPHHSFTASAVLIESATSCHSAKRRYPWTLDQNFSIEVARTFDDLMRAVAIRGAVYFGEQECPFLSATGRRPLPEIANDVRGGKVITVEFLVVTRGIRSNCACSRFSPSPTTT